MDIKPFSDYNLLPIYVRVADDLRSKLGHSPFDYGSLLPGEIELTKAYNLSRGTIRKALDILASEGLISRQPGRGTLILSPSAKDKARYRIAVVWSIIRAVSSEMFAGLESEVAEAGCDLLFSTSEHEPDKEAQILSRLLHSNIDGIVLYGTGDKSNNGLLKAFVQKGIPLILLDRFVPELREQVCWVTSANQQGAYEVTRHLIELGHRRIAHIIWTPDNADISTVVERRTGYVQALAEANTEQDDPQILSLTGPNWYRSNFPDVFWDFLNEQKPTALFFNNDSAAFRTLPILTQHGLNIPKDISVAGFDGLRLPFDFKPRNLTTVVQDFPRLGKEAGRAVIEMITHPKREPLHVRVPVTLHIGETSAPFTRQDSSKGVSYQSESTG
ncbi:MAG: substrate-binding domain-containing protein [Chloroflexi bacterium]|nr:substrate-binding domain-containing protein [Chloroflexota bacterium]